MSQPVVPPTHNAPHVLTALSAAEILLTFGHTRMMVADTEDSTAPTRAMQEWLFTVSMSPTAAQTLYAALGNTLMRYREMHGPILEDKVTVQRIMEVGKASLAEAPATTQ